MASLGRAVREATSPRAAATFLSGFVLVAVVAFADGGYYRDTWGWTAIALSTLACMVLLLRDRIALAWRDLSAIGALGTFVSWIALSAAWSSDPGDSLQEAERGLVYVAAVLAFLLLVDREEVRELLAGVAAAVTLVAVYSLGLRLFPSEPISSDPIQGTRLVGPLGYANALGILSAVGFLLSLGLAVHERTRLQRALWAAVPVLFVSTLTLTESRGTAFALVAGLGLFLVECRRSEAVAVVLTVAVPASVAAWLTWRSSALRDAAATLDETSDAGRRLALALALLAAVSALASLGAGWIEARLARLRALSWALSGAFAVALVGAILIAGVRSDRPLGPRIDYWRVAWGQWEENAWLGSGAGTFIQFWRREDMPVDVRDAHSLYLETLAELGPVGLALLLCALGLPLAAALKAGRHPLVAAAVAAYVAYLAHAGLDWDWEMPAVTLIGVLSGVALLAAAREGEGQITIGARARAGFTLAALAIAAVALAGRVVAV
jgi:O-antigen ligase